MKLPFVTPTMSEPASSSGYANPTDIFEGVTFPPTEDVSSSGSEETGNSEPESDTDETESQKSRDDTNDKDFFDKGNDKNDEGGNVTQTTSSSQTTSQTKMTTFTDAELDEMLKSIEQRLSELKVQENAIKKEKATVKKEVSTREKEITKKKKDEEKKVASDKKKAVRETTFQIIIKPVGIDNFPNSFEIEVANGDCFPDIRKIGAKKMGISNKKLKLTSDVFDLSVNPRTTIGKLFCPSDPPRKVKAGDTFSLSVIAKGGAKKRRSNDDIFFDLPSNHDVKETTEEKDLWGRVFKYCTEITTNKEYSTVTILKTIDKTALDKCANDLVSSKARVSDKLMKLASATPMAKEMQKVCDDITYNLERYKKQLAKSIYESGRMTGDTFEAGVVAGAIKQLVAGGTQRIKKT